MHAGGGGVAATVSVFGVNEAMSDQEFRAHMTQLAGDVASVSSSSAIPGCRLAEFWDVRAAHYALAQLNGSQTRVPTIVEVSSPCVEPFTRGVIPPLRETCIVQTSTPGACILGRQMTQRLGFHGECL